MGDIIHKNFFFNTFQLASSKLGRASGWLVMGGLVSGGFGYVFQVLMGRMLTVQEYGLFNALMAHLVILAAPMGTLTMMVSRKVSSYRVSWDHGSIGHFYYVINVRVVFAAGVIIAICFLFTGQIQSYVRASSVAPIYLMGLAFLLTVPRVINNSFLQGLQYFKWLSVSSILDVFFKTVVAVILVQIGYGVSGVFGGLIISSIVVWLIIYNALRLPLTAGRKRNYRISRFTFRSVLPVLIANIAFAVMTQLDLVLVKYYFTDYQAGVYAAAAILGKAVMYLPGYIALALFPMAAENHARGRDSASLLLQAIGLTTVLCSIGSLFYFFCGESVVTLLYGESYSSAGKVLKYYGLAMFPMAIIMIVEHFLIANGRVLFAYLFVIIAPLQLIAIHFFHSSLLMIVLIVGLSGLLHMIVGAGLLWQDFQGTKSKGAIHKNEQ